MTAAPDYLGTLRGALSGWLYDPRHTTAPYKAQAAHADAIEAALAECKREGLGDVADDLSRGHGWENTAACWVWRLPRWGDRRSTVYNEFEIESFMSIHLEEIGRCRWECFGLFIDWWDYNYFPKKPSQWTVVCLVDRDRSSCYLDLKSPEGLALLDTVRTKVTP